MGHWADDEVWRFMNRSRRGKVVEVITRCKFCRKRVHYLQERGSIFLAENHNGTYERHACKMKRNAGF